MVTAVIFDMGNILLDFHTRELAAAFTSRPEDADLLYHTMFEGPDWLTLDRGGLEETALAHMKERLPQRLWAAADQAMAHWDEFLVPNPEVNQLARELDGLGLPLYILSKTSHRFYRFREKIPVLPQIKGTLLSFEEHLLKPDLDIYRRLFARFGLTPGECFFIDDCNTNIEAARWCGMQAFHYQNNISKLRAALRQAGVPVAADD